jgi:hypothetical protein
MTVPVWGRGVKSIRNRFRVDLTASWSGTYHFAEQAKRESSQWLTTQRFWTCYEKLSTPS